MGEMGNRPDCAYFLLLGLCGAAFLLTIGGILTYIAFNPGAIDTHAHSALSHIPHFHHHKHHPASSSNTNMNNNHHHYQQQHDSSSQNQAHQTQTHHQTPQHQDHSDHRNPKTPNSDPTLIKHPHNSEESHSHMNKSSSNSTTKSSIVISSPSSNSTLEHHYDHEKNEKPLDKTSNRTKNSSEYSPGGHLLQQQPPPALRNHSIVHEQVQQPKSPDFSSSSPGSAEAYDAKAKQSLALAIIGPLCLLMGIIVTLIVGVLALRYDCDHEPEPNIAFLRLRSEMSLNFDSDKNNYELLRPSSSIDQAGGQYSINPTGLPRC